MKKFMSGFCLLAMLFTVCLTPVHAEETYTWVTEPVYDYIGLPGTTQAPFFTFMKDGQGGFLNGGGQPVFEQFAVSDMASSAFYSCADNHAYAVIHTDGGLTVLKDDGTKFTGEEAKELIAAMEVVPEEEILETISKTAEGDFDKPKAISFYNAQGQLLFAPIQALNGGNFHSGVAVVETEKNAFSLLDEAGNLTPVPNVKLNFTGFYYEDLCIAEKDGKFGLIQLSYPRCISVRFNGNKVYFDQLPVIENDRTLVPLRAIFEALDAQVTWDGETRTVSAAKGDRSVSLTIDDVNATVNGAAEVLDVPAKIINDRTMVPVRFIAQSFGADVDWNPDTRTVIITAN